MTDTGTYTEWLTEHPPPDLMELVERFGGFSRVPVEEWAKYDHAYRSWNDERMRRYQR